MKTVSMCAMLIAAIHFLEKALTDPSVYWRMTEYFFAVFWAVYLIAMFFVKVKIK